MTAGEKIAVIDLGTNTFHLLIIRVVENGKFELLLRMKKFVKLAQEGISKIGPRQFEKGLEVLREYYSLIQEHEIDKTYAFGTAALREASNGVEFCSTVLKETGISIQLIDGNREAELIYYGVRQAIDLGNDPVLIVDIGGGSVEFIIANKQKIYWKESYKIGASILKQEFHTTEPIAPDSVTLLKQYLNQQLQPLDEVMEEYGITHMVGASGSFETIADIIASNFSYAASLDGLSCYKIDISYYRKIHEQFLRFDLEQRLAMRGMIPDRADMIVVASILIMYLVDKYGIMKLTMSQYALKEGVIWSIINEPELLGAEG